MGELAARSMKIAGSRRCWGRLQLTGPCIEDDVVYVGDTAGGKGSGEAIGHVAIELALLGCGGPAEAVSWRSVLR